MQKRRIASQKQNLEYINILQESCRIETFTDREPARTDNSVWEIVIFLQLNDVKRLYLTTYSVRLSLTNNPPSDMLTSVTYMTQKRATNIFRISVRKRSNLLKGKLDFDYYYNQLITTVKRYTKPSTKVIISAVIPRPLDYHLLQLSTHL